jgi:enamine deaminase RidA (YjgF/YER057c/UK114 family)
MRIEQKLDALGLTLFDLDRQYRANPAGARFMSHLAVNNVLYLSGTTPMKDGRPHLTGVVGADLTIEQGYEAARYAALSSLAVIKYALGDLDRVEQAVQLIGFVNSAPRFGQQPRVINGATDLLVELYRDRGKPTRAAIGCQGLAVNHSVEIVLTVLFNGVGASPPLARDRYAQ